VTQSPPDFDRLSDLLREFDALQTAAELHGFLIGQLAGGRRFSRSEWLVAANEAADLGEHPDQRAGDELYALYQQALANLSGGELAFQPLLPADDEPLSRRVENLGMWCQGFLSGFGLAGGHTTSSAELAESLRDFAAIAQVASGDDGDPDQSESDLFSVSEYVRLSAVDIFWKHNPDAPAPAASQAQTAQSPANLFQRNKLH
jgi:yecA family protein